MIPLFPNFKKLELGDRQDIENLTLKLSGSSDFNFVSLWGYNTEEDIEISLLNENLVVKFRDYVTNERFYSFIGTYKIAETIDTLLDLSKNEGLPSQVKLIPEEIVSKNNLDGFFIIEDKDNFDYLLSIQEHVGLQTSRFYKHRKLINKFYRDNPSFTTRELDLKNDQTTHEVLDLFYLWENKKGKTRSETQHELIALKRTLKDFIELNLTVLGVYTNNQLIGLTIADENQGKYIQSHFFKYHPDYNGINHLLHHLLAKHFTNKGFEYINIEQDLGIPGLRRAKELSNPIKYLKKYTISKKSAN